MFYSQLDELLFEEQQKLERNTVKGQLKLILAADDKSQAFKNYLKSIWRETPLKTKITLWTVLAFLFVLVFGI